MLGFGAALKLLLLPQELSLIPIPNIYPYPLSLTLTPILPQELLPTATTRNEIVALFNTLHSFSAALIYVKVLGIGVRDRG